MFYYWVNKMVKKNFSEIEDELAFVHQQLTAGQVYFDAIGQIDQLIDDAKRETRTKVELPQTERRFVKEISTFIGEVQEGSHPHVDDELVAIIIRYSTVSEMMVRRLILVAIETALENNLISTDQLKILFRHFSQPEILMAHIAEPTNKAAFGRSLAVNILRLILIADRSGYFFLTQDEITEFLNTVGMLPIYEKDTRGFVSEVGWVHLFTGIANLASELAEHDELVRGDKIFLLATLIEGYKKIETSFVMGEDEDIANFLLKLFQQHQLYQDFFIEQVKEWRKELNNFNPYSKVQWVRLFNYRHLMQSLILDGNLPEKVMQAIVTD